MEELYRLIVPEKRLILTRSHVSLEKRALFNKLNSNFAKFDMAKLSGWSDKQQISGDADPLHTKKCGE